jgi:hypothetical protein
MTIALWILGVIVALPFICMALAAAYLCITGIALVIALTVRVFKC